MKKGLTNILFLCIGCIIGWGAFVLPQDLFLSKVGMLNAIIGLLIGALLMCIIACNYSFLLTKIPKTGGEFIFTFKVLGRTHGFICGWFLSFAYLCIIPLNATALSLLIDAFDWKFLHFNKIYNIMQTPIYLGDIILSCASIIVIALINIRGIKIALILQRIFVLILVISVFYCCISMSFQEMSWNNFMSYWKSHNLQIESILMVIAISPWLYLGFDCAVQIIADINYNKKIFEILTYVSIWIGALIYCATLLIVAFGTSEYELNKYSFAIGQSISKNFGIVGSIALALGIFVAIASGINGFFIATSKVIYAMSSRKMLPHLFSKQNTKGINYNIVIFIAAISCIAPFFGRKSLLYIVDMSATGIIIAFLYVGIVSFILKKHTKRISIMAICTILLSIFFLALLFLPYSPSALKSPSLVALMIWCIVGVAFYKIGNN